MKLYVIRHGETTWNTQARLQGMSDIPLNDNGVSLARKTGEAMRDIPFTRIYTSPLKRAVQTAELVAGGRQIPVVIEDRIREISFGEWEGLSCSRDNYEIPSDSFEQFFRDPFQFDPPKGGKVSWKSAGVRNIFWMNFCRNREMNRKRSCSRHTGVRCVH